MAHKNPTELEELARRGKWQTIERAILVNAKKKLNVSEAIHLAKLARRAYRLQLTLKILKDYVVNADGEFNLQAEPEALVEYAICLTMLGARNSALRILNQLKYSSASLHFAWITHYFSTYQHNSAISHIEKFIELQQDEYMKNVGRLNLCACKVTLALDNQLENDLNYLKSTFKKNGHSVLFANACELSAQFHIRNKNWNSANTNLMTAQQQLTDQDHLYRLFIDKWHLVQKMHAGSTSTFDLQNMLGRSMKLKSYHSIRDLLFHWGQSRDSKIVDKVYLGTPYEGYRRYIDLFNSSYDYQAPNEVMWNNNWLKHDYEAELVVNKSDINGVRFSKIEMSLLSALLEDFFEPKSVVSVFDSIFSDENFHPYYSVKKTYKVIERFKAKLQTSGLPIELINVEKKYKLKFNKSVAIQILSPQTHRGSTLAESQFLSAFANQPFSRSDVMSSFKLTKSTTVRWLNKLIETGKIRRIGEGPGSFYRVIAA